MKKSAVFANLSSQLYNNYFDTKLKQLADVDSSSAYDIYTGTYVNASASWAELNKAMTTSLSQSELDVFEGSLVIVNLDHSAFNTNPNAKLIFRQAVVEIADDVTNVTQVRDVVATPYSFRRSINESALVTFRIDLSTVILANYPTVTNDESIDLGMWIWISIASALVVLLLIGCMHGVFDKFRNKMTGPMGSSFAKSVSFQTKSTPYDPL
jgi:hypothetical protein